MQISNITIAPTIPIPAITELTHRTSLNCISVVIETKLIKIL
jgi:hypothetical protein